MCFTAINQFSSCWTLPFSFTFSPSLLIGTAQRVAAAGRAYLWHLQRDREVIYIYTAVKNAGYRSDCAKARLGVIQPCWHLFRFPI